VPAAHAAWLRYSTALASYALAALFIRWRGVTSPQLRDGFFLLPQGARAWLLALSLGFLTFCFSPLLQMTGLDASRATDNALIIAIEPLMTIVLARFFLGEAMARSTVLALAASLVGFAMLSGLNWERVTFGANLFGNLILLLSLTGEAAYSSLGRKLSQRRAPVAVFGTALLAGVVFLTFATAVLAGLPDLSLLETSAWLALLWLGPFGTALSYLYWMHALETIPVAPLALTLFVQPIAGTVWGYLFLDERLTPAQAAGGALILAAVFGQSLVQLTVKPALTRGEKK